MNGDFSLAWDIVQVLIIIGFLIGVIGAVVIGSIRIGWQFAPWIVLISVIIYLFGGI